MDNKLFFGGYTYAYGHELYVGDANKKQFAAARVSEILSQGLKPNTAFEVALFPNPSYGNAALQISGDAKSVSVSITDVQGKTVWQGTNKNARLINLPTERFAKGTYFVIVKNDSESKTIRFVKQ